MNAMESWLFSDAGDPIPLVGVRVDGEIVGQGARIAVSQRFRNRESEAVEAVYKFPLPDGATVCGFKVEKGGGGISGHVEEREKAFEIYDDALQEGKGGYLLDEERPNIFTLSVGNLNPGMEVLVHIDYVMLIESEGETLRFLLPMTITPRYIPDHKDNGDIPLDHIIHPPYAAHVPYGMEMRLILPTASMFCAIESPSHPIRVEQLPYGKTLVTFALRSVVMDRDFILILTLRDPRGSQAWLCRDAKGTFLQLDLFLEQEASGEAGDKAVFFVVDCSGSMTGDWIYEARQALTVCLKALKEGMYFNIVRFGSLFETLFPEPRPYSEATLNPALAWSQGMEADLGGTEILAPLQHIYRGCPEAISRPGAVLLLTDGAVSNEDEVISLVRSDAGLRMFPIGIGAGCNEAFIKGLARAGKGAWAFIYPGERMESKILGLFGKMLEEGMTPAVEWGSKADQAPGDPLIFTGGRTSLFARLEQAQGALRHVVVRGSLNGQAREWTIPVSLVTHDRSPVPLLWAREKIRDLEDAGALPSEKGSRRMDRKQASLAGLAIHLSKTYGILSRHTSFVAVEEREEKDLTTGQVLLRKIPVPVTTGWHGLGRSRSTAYQAALMPPSIPPHGTRYVHENVCEPRTMLSIEKKSITRFSGFTQSEWAVEMIMALLRSQRAKGGFEVDDRLAAALGLHMSELIAAAKGITPSTDGDVFTLLWSATLLQVLEQRFPAHQKSWEKAVKKTRKWLEKTIEKQKPTVQGEPLLSWAARYVATHPMADSTG